MASLFKINEIIDERGNLAVLQEEIPFPIQRVFFIYKVPENTVRGQHRHKKNRMVLICLSGSCKIDLDDGLSKKTYTLKHPTQCLLVEPTDFHSMKEFSAHSTLLVLASEKYDSDDYIHESYQND